MFENVSWGNFKIKYNEFNIDKQKDLFDQLDSLQENMLRATAGDYILDISYEHEVEQIGFFTVLLIKKKNWEDPYMEKRTNSLKQLEKIVQEFIYMV